MRVVRLSLVLLLAATAFAQKVTVESDQNADFSKFKTFAIRNGRLNSKNAALNSDLVKKQIEADITKDLAAKGLAPADGKADLNIRYTLGSGRKMEREAYPAGWRGWGTRVVKVPYAEGTLVIDFHDPGSQSLVWRAIATDEKSDPNKLAGKIDDMVRKAIDKYPPKKK